jgi:hypothetical protein
MFASHSTVRRALKRTAAVAACLLAGVTCRDSTGPDALPVASLAITPDGGTVEVGETLTLRAEPRDAVGQTLSGARLSWTSLDPARASVADDGTVRGLAAGRALIAVSSGGAADTAEVVVRSGTTRLTAERDSLGAIGQSAQLVATTTRRGAPVAGSYYWVSRDTAVAAVTQEGRVVARGSGVTYVVAREDGFSADSVKITVRLRVARVVVTPAAASRPQGRTTRFTAAALDDGGARIPGLTYAWSSRRGHATPSPSSADTNTVSGASPGVDTIVVGVAGSTVTGIAELTVLPMPKLRINRDTIDAMVNGFMAGYVTPQPRVTADDRVGATAVAFSLSAPDVATAPASVSIAEYGSDWARFDVVGRRPGTALLVATAPGYRPDTAVVRVSSPRFVVGTFHPAYDTTRGPLTTSRNVAIGAFARLVDTLGAEQHTAALVPFTFTSSDPAVVTASASDANAEPPDLGVTFVITPTGTGRAWVRVSAPGFPSDSVEVTVVPQKLQFANYDGSFRAEQLVGVGQINYCCLGRVVLGSGASGPTTITFAQKHPELVRFSPAGSATVASGMSWLENVRVEGLAAGVDTIIASAPGFAPDTLIVRVTTPTFTINRMYQDSLPATGRVGSSASATIIVADSTGGLHYVSSSVGVVQVRVTSSDPSVIRPAVETFGIGTSTSGGGFRFDFVGPGTATLTLTDPTGRHRPFTTRPITVLPTPIAIGNFRGSGERITLGAGQRVGQPWVHATIGSYQGTSPLQMVLSSSDSSVARPVPVQIEGQGATVHFDVIAGRPGTAYIVASGPGLVPDTLRVDVGRPKLSVQAPARVYAGGAALLRIDDLDQAGQETHVLAEDVPLRVISSDPSVLAVDSATVTLRAGDANGVGSLPVYAGVRGLSRGTAVVRVVDARTGENLYEPAAVMVDVAPPPLLPQSPFNPQPGVVVGVGSTMRATLHRPVEVSGAPATVTITHRGDQSATPATVTFAAGASMATYDIQGKSLGSDTLVFSAPGYVPARFVVQVKAAAISIFSPAEELALGDSISARVYLSIPGGSAAHTASAATTISIGSSDHLALVAGGQAITSVTVPAGQSYSTIFWMKARKVGTATITASGPSLTPFSGTVQVR